MSGFYDQQWFQIAGEVVLMFTVVTGAMPDKWVQNSPI